MSTTISKGRVFRVTTTVDDDRLRAMRKAPEATADAQRVGAEYWHSGILPKHFKAGAGAVYGYAARASKYLRDRKKQGKPSLVYSGTLRADVLARVAIKVMAGGGVDARVSARVLNLAPTMPENSLDLYVKHKNGRGYPNLKREIKTMTDDDREYVAAVVAYQLELAFNPAAAASVAHENALKTATLSDVMNF